MTSIRLRAAAAVGLAFFPMPWNFFHLMKVPAYAESPAPRAPCTWSNSPVIRLPLQIDEKTRAQLTEIKLYVKAPNSGWAVAQTGPPTQPHFDFRAPKDGKYAFMFVSVDKAGRNIPENLESRPAHQIIIVDTLAPELSVMPLPVANRDIFLQVRMEDAHPDRSSIKLEYSIGDNTWRPMELAQADTPGVFRIPHASVLEGKVRVSGKDKAGNVAMRIVDLGDATHSFASDKPQEREPHLKQIVKSEPPLLPPGEDPAPQTSVRPPDAVTMKITDAPAYPTRIGYNPNRPKPVASSDPVAIPEVIPAAATKVADTPVVTPTIAEQKATVPDPYFPPVEIHYDSKPVEHAAPREQPALREEPAPAPRAIEAIAAESRPAAPAKGTREIINTTRCTLDYAVENVLVGGQPTIEFWATRDNGRSWQRLQDEAGGRTPARLVLPGDGDYGIRVKANGDGQSPHLGEAPDAWVEVDTTRPTVRLLPPTIGTGADAGTLTIQWQVNDKNLIADSINIYHASRPTGPWVPIATGLRNEGSYRWLIPGGIGADIYMRLEATDRAGNLGQSELNEPINLPQPKIRIIGIGPAR